MKKSMFQFLNELIALNDSFANLTNPLLLFSSQQLIQ